MIQCVQLNAPLNMINLRIVRFFRTSLASRIWRGPILDFRRIESRVQAESVRFAIGVCSGARAFQGETTTSGIGPQSAANERERLVEELLRVAVRLGLVLVDVVLAFDRRAQRGHRDAAREPYILILPSALETLG